MLRTLAFLVLRQVLGLAGRGQSPDAKDVEIAVLRHQLAVLHRQIVRPRYTPADRMVLASLAKLLPRDRWPVFLVTPSTLFRWHRELVRRRWTYPAKGRTRPALGSEVVDRVLRLARENPGWGYVRIVGECRKLGVRISATSVRTAVAPNLLWCGDLTEIVTGEGKLYLAAVLDLFSRRCLGYAFSDHHDAVAATLNSRPRKTLGWKTPAEALNEQLLCLQSTGVATTG